MDHPGSIVKCIRELINQHGYRLLYLLIPAIIYLPGVFGWTPYPTGKGTYTDLLLTHYPNSMILKKSILEDFSLPLWSNLIYSGTPFAANPLSGFWYLPGWIAMFFSLPAGISLALAVHGIFGSLGFYLFLREEGVGEKAAILGGLAFGLMPKINVHYGGGHVSLLYALAWTPWLFWVSRKDQKGWRTGLVAAFLFLADPRWAVFTGLFWIFYSIAYRKFPREKGGEFYLQAGFVAFLISSPLIIPLLEYVNLSTRSMLTATESLVFSMPPEKLAGMIIPISGGNIEWFSYVGGLAILMFGLQLFVPDLRKENRFWSSWVVISIIIAFGSYLPGMKTLASLPIISLLRVPPRSFFLLGFCQILIMVKVIDWLLDRKIELKHIRLVGLAFFLISIGLMLGLYIIGPELKFQAFWGLIFIGVSSLICLVLSARDFEENWLWIFFIVIVFDYCGIGFLNNKYIPTEDVFEDSKPITSVIAEDQDIFRLHSPSYSIPQYIAVKEGLELSDGVDPMQITSYRDFMDRASGIESKGYSVTIPPFETGNPEIDNIGAKPDSVYLGLLNVKYLVSAYKIEVEGFELIGEYPRGFLYRNQHYFSRAWIQPQYLSPDHPPKDHEIKEVIIVDRKANHISLVATGPGKLILSEIEYPGWVAKVNDKAVSISPAYNVLRSIDLPPGENEIDFRYVPSSIYGGLVLGIVGWGYCLYKRKERDVK